MCCGLAEAQTTDDSRTLLARADSALYSAKAAGSNRTFVHTGSHIREHHSLGNQAASTADAPSRSSAKGTTADCLVAVEATPLVDINVHAGA